MAQHKIQSSEGLTLELQQVPKMLGKLTQQWAPRSFVVSFKLETDENILFQKAGGAIRNYNVHLVVANILNTRADTCYIVAPMGVGSGGGGGGNKAGAAMSKAEEGVAVQDRAEGEKDAEKEDTQSRTERGYRVAPLAGSTGAAGKHSATATASASSAGAVLQAGESAQVVDGRNLRIRVLQREAQDVCIEPLLVRYVAQEYYRHLRGAKEGLGKLGEPDLGARLVRTYVQMFNSRGSGAEGAGGEGKGKQEAGACTGAHAESCGERKGKMWAVLLTASLVGAAIGFAVLRARK